VEQFLKKYRIPLSIVAFLIALGISVVYYFLVPDEAANTSGVLEFILQHGHSIVWVFLSLAALSMISSKTQKIAKWFAYLALLAYLAFFVALLIATGEFPQISTDSP